MRLRATYEVNGQTIRRIWVDHTSYLAAANWPERTLEVSRPRWASATDEEREVALLHELAHLLWWRHHEDEDHPTWLLRHDYFARSAARVHRIARTGRDKTCRPRSRRPKLQRKKSRTRS